MFLRAMIVTILFMPIFVGMTGFVSRSEAVPEIAAAGMMAPSGQAASVADHSVCRAGDYCEWGQCVNCTVLPARPEALGIAPSAEALLLSILSPLPSGRNIRPAQEPARPV